MARAQTYHSGASYGFTYYYFLWFYDYHAIKTFIVTFFVAPVIVSRPMDVEILPNSLITFECVIMPEPGSLVNVTWSGPDPLPSFETTSLGNMIRTNISFNVQNGSNAGLPYNCSANYFRCTARASASAIFTIIILPSIIELPQNHIGRYLSGNNTISCTATVTGALSISWTGPITGLVPMITTTMEGNRKSVLNFDLLQYSEGGVYTCTASNDAGSVSASAMLFVEPQIFSIPSDGLVRVGETAVLMCMVQDDQFVSVQWQKQNLTFEYVPGEIESNLTFSSIVFGNEGIYRCVVTTRNFGVRTTDAVTLTGMFTLSTSPILQCLLAKGMCYVYQNKLPLLLGNRNSYYIIQNFIPISLLKE